MPAVTPWLWRPDGPVLERLEWMTDVVPSYSGREQRVALRSAPRRGFEFAVCFSDTERRRAEARLHQWQAQPWALPIWMDSQTLAAPISPGATSVSVATDYRDFSAGGLLLLLSATGAYEALTIASAGSGTVGLAEPVAGSWPAGTEVLPARMARMADEIQLRRFSGATSYGAVRFELSGPGAWPAATGGTTYRSRAVLVEAPNWVEDPEQGFTRRVARVDAGVGLAYLDEEASGAILRQSHRWLLDGRAQIDAHRRWLHARQGRLVDCWVPTFAQDLTPVATIGSAATTIDVAHCEYTAALAQGIGRRDIRILLGSGTAYHRRITASAVISATVERLTIDSALGATVQPADVAMVSFMDLMRHESDAVELNWWRCDVVEAALVLRGSRNDL